ncbi:TetR/AcrR family transcriptional regulator [Aurantiacibacter spongiae]|uniref:TetR/AcrR family transcriptional regulator n=1 Tax=Aurantiacibacter spongiae TaxID=2488860 RepID=A0A3N5CQJ8_9SPHN|nr:TetR/AcrR family transcriptional regulator [Aurantiacibacter spongiae]RPF71294.1 TetR/AcrR family transcriptional regulator [Aurantiacibacter spongiae]
MTPSSECDRLAQRRTAIVAAARALFVEQGFDRTTLNQVVAQAGGSLATVYKLFGNKEGLLDAVVKEKIIPGTEIVRRFAGRGGDPGEILRMIGSALHARFLNPEDIALTRLVISRSVADPHFARHFFETTASLTKEAMTGLFERWRDAGVALAGDPASLAEIFVGLIVNDLQQEAMSHGAVARTSVADLDRRIDFFLRGAGLQP